MKQTIDGKTLSYAIDHIDTTNHLSFRGMHKEFPLRHGESTKKWRSKRTSEWCVVVWCLCVKNERENLCYNLILGQQFCKIVYLFDWAVRNRIFYGLNFTCRLGTRRNILPLNIVTSALRWQHDKLTCLLGSGYRTKIRISSKARLLKNVCFDGQYYWL